MTARPLLLDLFCGAGGAAMGYYRAGFDVIGVDIEPQPDYPFPFYRGDALQVVDLFRFDAIHASPPCRDHCALAPATGGPIGTGFLLPATRELLATFTGPWVIENVEGAPMVDPITLCGTEFDLSTIDMDGNRRWLKRHRLFESNVPLRRAGTCSCRDGRPIGGVFGRGGARPDPLWYGAGRRRGGYQFAADCARSVLGVPWMNRDSAAQAIPPVYTEHIGHQLLEHLR